MADTWSSEGANRVRNRAADASLILILGAHDRSTGSNMCSSSSRDLTVKQDGRTGLERDSGGGEGNTGGGIVPSPEKLLRRVGYIPKEDFDGQYHFYSWKPDGAAVILKVWRRRWL